MLYQLMLATSIAYVLLKRDRERTERLKIIPRWPLKDGQAQFKYGPASLHMLCYDGGIKITSVT